jgi:hypothetical protein
MLFGNSKSFLLLPESLETSGASLNHKQIQSLSFSDHHALAVLSTGEVLAIGHNDSGALGIGTTNDASILTLVRIRSKIISAFAGTGFSLFLTDTHSVLSSGLNGPLFPIESEIKATKLTGFRSTVAVITPDNRLCFWPDFHNFDESNSHDLPSLPKTISCGDKFAVVLLDSQVLIRFDWGWRSSVLYVPKMVFTGGAQFVAVSASDSYVLAIDGDHRGWIFGEFNGFPQKTIESTPVFESVRQAFAFPNYAVGITAELTLLGIGRLPESIRNSAREFEKVAYPLIPQRTNYVAGNEKEFVALPPRYTYERALQIADEELPDKADVEIEIE